MGGIYSPQDANPNRIDTTPIQELEPIDALHKSNNHRLKIGKLSAEFSDQYIPNLPNDHQEYQQQHDIYDNPIEVLTSSDRKDDRVRATGQHYDDPQSFIHSIGVLRSKYKTKTNRGTTTFSGVGTAVILKTHSDKLYLLTAAHNIIRKVYSLGTNIVAEKIHFELRENTNSLFSKQNSIKKQRFTVVDYWIHPEYTKTLASDSGYDIAILKCGDDEDHINAVGCEIIETLDNFATLLDAIKQYQSNRTMGCDFKACDMDQMRGCVVGYPAEKRGQLYGMKGNLFTPNHNKSIFMYNNIGTSPGQSGAPMVTSDNIIHDKLYDSNKYVVGIHTAGQLRINWGSKITPQIYEWITNTINYDKYRDKLNFKRRVIAPYMLFAETLDLISPEKFDLILDLIETFFGIKSKLKNILGQNDDDDKYDNDNDDDDDDDENVNVDQWNEWIRNIINTQSSIKSQLAVDTLNNKMFELTFGHKRWFLNLAIIDNQCNDMSSIGNAQTAKYASLCHKMQSLNLQ